MPSCAVVAARRTRRLKPAEPLTELELSYSSGTAGVGWVEGGATARGQLSGTMAREGGSDSEGSGLEASEQQPSEAESSDWQASSGGSSSGEEVRAGEKVCMSWYAS